MTHKIKIICPQCKKEKEVWVHSRAKFCSYQCSADNKYSLFIEEWKQNLVEGSYPNCKNSVNKRVIKYFKENVHNCSECDIGKTWNNKPLVLEIDHIDGDRSNNYYSNLRYICPNCHSQTDTFRAKNIKKRGPIV
jgi:Zn finger protein HypA/HybF involved in hydrogenase expression